MMERVELKIRSDTPFCRFSQAYPDLKIYRWCSSVVDYAEIIGRQNDISESSEKLAEIVNGISSEILLDSGERGRRTTAISCRCNVNNSTIRLAESMNLLWEAPALYYDGYEHIRLISMSHEDLSEFFARVSGKGDVQIVRKKTVQPESLRDIYTISLSDLLGDLSELQLRYIRDAIGMGFFSSPRRMKVEELAARHGVSKSTMQEHVNKARNKLIRAMEPYLALYTPSGGSTEE